MLPVSKKNNSATGKLLESIYPRGHTVILKVYLVLDLDFKGVKLPTAGRQFSKYDEKDKDGHLPYHYKSNVRKLERIKSEMKQKKFLPVGTAHQGYFGMNRIRYDRSSAAQKIQHRSCD